MASRNRNLGKFDLYTIFKIRLFSVDLLFLLIREMLRDGVHYFFDYFLLASLCSHFSWRPVEERDRLEQET